MGDDQSANNIATAIKQAINDRYDHLLLSALRAVARPRLRRQHLQRLYLQPDI
jgi:hypothetical protein